MNTSILRRDDNSGKTAADFDATPCRWPSCFCAALDGCNWELGPPSDDDFRPEAPSYEPTYEDMLIAAEMFADHDGDVRLASWVAARERDAGYMAEAEADSGHASHGDNPLW